MPESILFVHQGFELYGSDRTLVQSVNAAAVRWPNARITVLLPNDGALRSVLQSVVADVRIVNLAILRKSHLKTMKMRDAVGLLKKILEARRTMQTYDMTYINTAVVMDYILAACAVSRPRIVHVHEIPTGPAKALFSAILALSRSFVVFNSRATGRSYWLPPWQRNAVVWNGVAAPLEPVPEEAHARLNLLLIGRFNSWKGQSILLKAVAQLPAEVRAQLSVRLVGSVFGDQDHFTDKLARTIADQNLSNVVEMFPFTSDPSRHYSWADVVVVPSTKPEPFGLVAIEAMAAGRSVIAADHGGLSEIVVNGVTGTFVVPGSVESLASAIMAYFHDPARAAAEGIAGRERFKAQFEETHYKLKITNIIAELFEPKLG
jgi:glycosyltransferase involved in cell wall biosynthesis